MALDSGITHRDVGNADIAGANICPCRNDEVFALAEASL